MSNAVKGNVVERAVVPHSTPAGNEADEVQTFPNQTLVSIAESPARVPAMSWPAPPRRPPSRCTCTQRANPGRHLYL